MAKEEKSISEEGIPENKSLDLGLGMQEFLNPSNKTEDKPEEKKKEIAKEEKKDANTHKEGEDEKQEKEKEVKIEEEKKDVPPEGDKKQEQKKDEKEGDKVDKAGEGKTTEVKEEEKTDWEKRYKDTSNWATSQRSENKELKKQIEVLGKKIDGTWDEEAEKEKESKSGFSDELKGKMTASYQAALKEYGQEFMERHINNPNSDYQKLREKNPHIDERIKSADQPFMEAVKYLKEEQFFEKYGRDTEKIIEKIKEELEPELRKLITRELQEKISVKEKVPSGIRDVKGAVADKKEGKDNGFKVTPLDKILTG